MKCKNCGYEEQVPLWVLEELHEFNNDESYEMCCPNCDDTMYEKNKTIK